MTSPNQSWYTSGYETSTDETYLRNFAHGMLKGKIFKGTFTEKRRVNEINVYRDIIEIHPSERNLIRDVETVQRRLRGSCNQPWIGITTLQDINAPVGHCFWVELDEEVFGEYSYKIKDVRFRRNEIIVVLKQVRPITENALSDTSSQAKPNFDNITVENITEEVKVFLAAVWVKLLDVLTVQNIKEATTFLFVLFVALVTGSIELVKYLLNFSLKFMRELSHIIQVSTPFLMGVLGMLEKFVGGFYLLLAMLWRDFSPSRQQIPMNQMLKYEGQHMRGYNGFQPNYRKRRY